MIAFVDSSVVLRLVLGEPRPLAEWPRIEVGYASRLLLVEVGRSVDRLRLAGHLEDVQVAELREQVQVVLDSLEIVELGEAILERAQGPMPTALGTLDALHLATALEVAGTLDAPLRLATHDGQLATAARASGLAVIGASR